jgi:hypothetical protein
VFGTVAVKLMAFPAVKDSMNLFPHALVPVPAPTPKYNVSALAGWVVVPVVVWPAVPVIDP